MTTNLLSKLLSKKAAFMIETTSQWIEAGGLANGWVHLTTPIQGSSDKTISVKAMKWNGSATKQFETVAWLPKSQIVAVENDYKIEGQNYLVPNWLIEAKENEGVQID
jgi:hypothetical protein